MPPRKPPKIYEYYDYRKFLKDWFDYLKASQRGFSVRKMLLETDLALGTVSSIIAGSLPLSDRTLEKLEPHLKMSKADIGYLRDLRTLGESNSDDERQRAFRGIQRYLKARKVDLKGVKTYRYLTKWYYIAIRELMAVQGAKIDPEWIQSQLKHYIPLRDIRRAITFLKKNELIDLDPKGKSKIPKISDDPLIYEGGFYRIALANYLGQYLELAKKSITKTPREKRYLAGYTVAITEEKFQQIKKILDECYDNVVQETSEGKNADRVYHVSLEAFPVSEPNGGSQDPKGKGEKDAA